MCHRLWHTISQINWNSQRHRRRQFVTPRHWRRCNRTVIITSQQVICWDASVCFLVSFQICQISKDKLSTTSSFYNNFIDCARARSRNICVGIVFCTISKVHTYVLYAACVIPEQTRHVLLKRKKHWLPSFRSTMGAPGKPNWPRFTFTVYKNGEGGRHL